MSDDASFSGPVVFNKVTYDVEISTIDGGETLVMALDHQTSCDRWSGEFTTAYVEEITRKTGNFKRFPIFMRMLVLALQGKSSNVFVDLLTYADLEILRQRRRGDVEGEAAPVPPHLADRRYLIMTYTAEYDRVHYPLPLSLEQPSVEVLKRRLINVRSELEVARSNALDRGESETRQEKDINRLNGALDTARREVDEARRSYLRLKKESLADIQALKAECEALSADLESQTTQATRVESKLGLSRDKLKTDLKAAKKELVKLQERLNSQTVQQRRTVAKLEKQVEEGRWEIEKLKKRIKDMEREKRRTNSRPWSAKPRPRTAAKPRPVSRPATARPPRPRRTPHLGSFAMETAASRARSTGTRGRGQSPPRMRRSSSIGSNSSVGSRVSSLGPTFDPTAWVRGQEEKRRSRMRSSSRDSVGQKKKAKATPSGGVAWELSRARDVVRRQVKESPEPSPKPKSEPSDIDARLAALQDFLKRAKEGKV